MDTYLFAPDLAVVGTFPGLVSITDLAQEVGVHSASPNFVRDNCGPIANSILDVVPDAFYDEATDLGLFPNIDVRIHRLYPGDFPAYPGWHCDGEYRETYQSQPDLTRVAPHRHLVATASTEPGGVSLTEFVTSPFSATFHEPPSAANTLWGQVHRQVSDARESAPDRVEITRAQDGSLYQFSSTTLHRACPATVRGWRLFLRLSMWHKPYLSEAGGSISRQEQVYQLSEGRGW